MNKAILKFSVIFFFSLLVVFSVFYNVKKYKDSEKIRTADIYDSEKKVLQDPGEEESEQIESDIVIVEPEALDPKDQTIEDSELSEPDTEIKSEESTEPEPEFEVLDPKDRTIEDSGQNETDTDLIPEETPEREQQEPIVVFHFPDSITESVSDSDVFETESVPEPELVFEAEPEVQIDLEPDIEDSLFSFIDIEPQKTAEELDLNFEKPFIPVADKERLFQLYLSESFLDNILKDESIISSLDIETDIHKIQPDFIYTSEDSALQAEKKSEEVVSETDDMAPPELTEPVLELPPFLTIESPDENEYYRSEVEILFLVFNDENDKNFNRISRLYWIPPGGEAIDINIQDQNLYSISMKTEDISGPLSIKIVAQKDNGLVFERIVRMNEDLKGPSITIISPEENSTIVDSLQISGTLQPLSEDFVSVDEIESLYFQVGDEEEQEVEFNEAGDFELLIEKNDFSGLFFVKLTATDRNHHSSMLNFPVLGSIPDASEMDKPPVLIISSPENNSYYYSRISVTGTVLNDSENPGTDLIQEFYWSYAGSEQKNDIEFSDDGSFDFKITTVDMNHDLSLVFTIVKKGNLESTNLLTLRNDRTGPEISLYTPETNQYYSNSIRVSGQVNDFVNGKNEVKSIYWSTSGEPDKQNLIFIEGDGEFDFNINTENMNGLIAFQLSASDLNNNLSSTSVELNDGKKPPVIVLESPESGAEYGAGITIRGKITDPYSWNSDFGGIEKVVVKMVPAGIVSKGELTESIIPLEENGTFDYVMRTDGREGEQNLVLSVFAENGNYSEVSTKIAQSDFPISDFKVSQEGDKLILDWTTLPFISNYYLKYTSDKSDPDYQTSKGIDNVLPPLELSNMEDGALYSFLLTGETDSEEVHSDIIRLIPMTDNTLEPVSNSEFNYVEISWLPIEGIDSYNVLRSLAGGKFSIIAENISDTRYLDRSAIFGKIYDYKVIPSNFTEVESYIVSGELLAEPPLRLTKKDSLMNIKPDSIKIMGDYAYIASKDEGLYIVDISDPDDLSIRGFIMIDGARNLTLSGEFAVVAAGENGYSIINISEPANPRFIGSRSTTNAVSASLKDGYIYIADGIKGLKIYSMSEPKRPPRVYVNDDFEAYDVKISGQYLYVSTGITGLVIYNIADPESPQFAGRLDDINIISSEISGKYCFSASGTDGVNIIDISNPENPFWCSRYSTENALSIFVKENHLLVADGEGGLVDIDVTDPYRPKSFEQMNLSYSSSVGVSENIVLVADRSGLLSVESFQYGQSFKIGEIVTEGDAYSATILDEKLYIAGHSSGFAVVSIDDPENVSSEDILYRIPSTYAEQIWIEDDKLFLADGSGGIKVYLLEQDQFILSEEIKITGNAKNICITEEYIFAAAGKGGIQGRFRYPSEKVPQNTDIESMPLEAVDDRTLRYIADISIPFPDIRDLVFSDNYIFAADRQKGLIVIDFSVPESYSTVTEVFLPGAISIELNNNRLFVAHAEGITIFDIKDKNFPDELIMISSPYVEDIKVEDSILFVAEGHAGLSVYNVKDHNKILKVSECSDVFADSIAISDGYAYVADSTGINIVKIYIPRWIK